MQSTNLPDGEVEELHYFKMRIKQMEKESLALREVCIKRVSIVTNI